MKTASTTNGGFIYYTQPPAWFYAHIAGKHSEYHTINLLTHVPNSQYVLSVVAALKSIPSVHTVRVLTSDLQSDFGLLLRSQNIVPSISTFAWWSVFLGNGWHQAQHQQHGSEERRSRRVVHIGRTGFWHPQSVHRSQFCMEFEEEEDLVVAADAKASSGGDGGGSSVLLHEYTLEVSDTWQNTNEQRARAFSSVIPTWFADKYSN